MKFSRPAERLEDILNLIAIVATGSKLLDAFLPLLKSGKVTIEGYPAKIVQRLRTEIGADHPIGACFANDSRTGTIYIDLASPIGLVAPFLVHEITHSLDAAVWDAGKLKPSEKNCALLKAEVAAFQAQQDFMTELRVKVPEYEKFLKTCFPRARILHERLTREDISDLYGFKRRA